VHLVGFAIEIQNRDFCRFAGKNEMMFLMENGMGLEKFEIGGNKSSIRGCCMM